VIGGDREEQRPDHRDADRAAELLHRVQHARRGADLVVVDAGQHEVEQRGEHPEGEAFIAEMRRYFSSLPVDRFPHIVALAVPLTTNDSPDARFEFGLDALVRGIDSMK
jgi:hypothetical protein